MNTMWDLTCSQITYTQHIWRVTTTKAPAPKTTSLPYLFRKKKISFAFTFYTCEQRRSPVRQKHRHWINTNGTKFLLDFWAFLCFNCNRMAKWNDEILILNEKDNFSFSIKISPWLIFHYHYGCTNENPPSTVCNISEQKQWLLLPSFFNAFWPEFLE